jgi:hypothetical protein
MRWFLRGCVLTAALVLLSVLASGCTQSNESYADIKGQPPPDGGPKTQADAYAQMQRASAGLKSQGYPGTGGKRSASAPVYKP